MYENLKKANELLASALDLVILARKSLLEEMKDADIAGDCLRGNYTEDMARSIATYTEVDLQHKIQVTEAQFKKLIERSKSQ